MSEIVKLNRPVGKVRLGAPVQIAHALPSLSRSSGGGRASGDDAPTRTQGDPVAPNSPEQEYLRGFEEGRRQGYSAGCREMEETIRKDRARMETLAASISEEYKKLAGRLEREAFHFALAVGGKIARREVSLDDQIVVRQVQEALHRIVGVETIKLRVHPHDEPVVRAQRPALISSTESVREIVIETDDKIEPGGCVIESSSGNVDARLTTQLKQIEAALFPTAKELD